MKKGECWKCKKEGRDRASDNASYYDDGGVYCFAGHGTLQISDDLRHQLDEQKQEENWEFNLAQDFNEEDHLKLKEITSYEGKGLRGIRDEIYKFFGVRHEYDTETGDVTRQYYPVTTDYEFSGYKRRTLPKKFDALGTVGNDNELFGQFRFQHRSGKFVVVVGGEIDQLSAFQMLKDYQDSKGYEFIPVVSPTTGETGSAKQLQKQYAWFDKFERIILCYDNDPAGIEATEKAAKVLPKDKVYVMQMSLKDPNEYLTEGKEREFINCFFKAYKHTPTGVLGSDRLMDRVLEQATKAKLPFPPFMKRLNKVTANGIPLRNILNIGAASGIGKTTIINELIYYWIFNSPYTMGVVSMELDAGQYGEVMLSRHIGKKIALIEDPQEKYEFLIQDSISQQAEDLFKKPDGSPRWHLVEDRDGDIKSIQKTIEELIIKCECKVIVLDPLQDLLDGLNNEDQATFMKWMKQMIKTYDVIFVLINHIRKSGQGEKAGSAGAFITEEDFQGSSSIFKSAACNVLVMRNKYSEDETERNTTHCTVSKCRWTGYTGPGGEWYYDNLTHTMWDREEYFDKHKKKF